jgi:hypothetical protein
MGGRLSHCGWKQLQLVGSGRVLGRSKAGLHRAVLPVDRRRFARNKGRCLRALRKWLRRPVWACCRRQPSSCSAGRPKATGKPEGLQRLVGGMTLQTKVSGSAAKAQRLVANVVERGGKSTLEVTRWVGRHRTSWETALGQHITGEVAFARAAHEQQDLCARVSLLAGYRQRAPPLPMPPLARDYRLPAGDGGDRAVPDTALVRAADRGGCQRWNAGLWPAGDDLLLDLRWSDDPAWFRAIPTLSRCGAGRRLHGFARFACKTCGQFACKTCSLQLQNRGLCPSCIAKWSALTAAHGKAPATTP